MDKDEMDSAERFWRQVEQEELKRFSETLGDSFKKFEGMSYDEVMTHIRENHLRLLEGSGKDA